MNRAIALLIPFAFAACGTEDVGGSCKADDDCNDGLVCDKATDATEDEEGECAEEMVDPTTPGGTT